MYFILRTSHRSLFPIFGWMWFCQFPSFWFCWMQWMRARRAHIINIMCVYLFVFGGTVSFHKIENNRKTISLIFCNINKMVDCVIFFCLFFVFSSLVSRLYVYFCNSNDFFFFIRVHITIAAFSTYIWIFFLFCSFSISVFSSVSEEIFTSQFFVHGADGVQSLKKICKQWLFLLFFPLFLLVIGLISVCAK